MTDENRLAPTRASDARVVPAEPTAQSLATPEQVAAFQEQFMRLLERRTAIYTMGDSTSVPKHVAVDLLQSICFVLGIDPDDPELTPDLLGVDLEDEYRRRLAEIERKVALSHELWREASIRTPHIENIALRDTLAEIGRFPQRYDFRSMAHEIPVSIDYPLCHPVDESLPGVDYINEYLRRVIIEADFLERFEVADIERVLAAASPDYIELLVNLYEPVATNAIGLALLGEDPRPLAMDDARRAEIARRLGPLPRGERLRSLREAAGAACVALGIEDAGAREYLRELVPELLPRVEVGLGSGGLGGVFAG